MKNDIDKKIQNAWLKAAEELAIEVEAPFTFTKNGEKHSYILLIRNFGAKKGTLIQSLIEGANINEKLAANGFSISFLNPHHYIKYNRRLFIRTLKDWKWCGAANEAPKWY